MRSTVRRLSAAVLGGAASAGLVLGLAAGSHAATILSGVNLTVASDDSVTVTSNGNSVFFGNVGSAGSYGFINGWGVSSGTVTWRDTNNNVAATLSSSGVNVPASNRIANSNGSKSGSVTVTGSPALGAALRASFGAGVHAYTSTVAQGSVAFEFSGTATIAKEQVTLVSDLVLSVRTDLGNAVGILDGGTANTFGSVGAAGDFGFENGWGVSSGTLTWRNTLGDTAATLDATGVHVPVSGRLASSVLGGVDLTGSTDLGTSLANELGEGTHAFSSIVAESATTEFYVEGMVMVPEPASELLGCATLLALAGLRLLRAPRAA